MHSLPPCQCSTGGPCDGHVSAYRTAPKHGGRVVTARPAHREAPSTHPLPSGAFTTYDWRTQLADGAALANRVDSLPDITVGMDADSPPAHVDPVTANCGRLTSRPAPRTVRSVVVAQGESTDIPMRTSMDVARRNRRATLNTTVKGGADRATDVADHDRATLCAGPVTFNTTRRERRAARARLHNDRRATR